MTPRDRQNIEDALKTLRRVDRNLTDAGHHETASAIAYVREELENLLNDLEDTEEA